MTRAACLLLLLLSPLAAAETLQLDGEIAALDSASVAPPTVRNVWNFQITQLATDGSTLKAGQPVVTFDGNELQRRRTEREMNPSAYPRAH